MLNSVSSGQQCQMYKVTVGIANHAYDEVFNCHNGGAVVLSADDISVFDLHTNLVGFGLFLNEKLIMYIDVMAGRTVLEMGNNNEDDNNKNHNTKPVVLEKIMGNQSGTIQFSVLKVSNLFLPDKAEQIKSTYDKLMFMKGTSSEWKG